MIIYAAQPNRFYPYFFKKLFDIDSYKHRPRGKTVDLFYKESPERWYSMSLFAASFQSLHTECKYHQSFDSTFKDRELMFHENGKNYIHFDDKFRNETNMVLGILNTERIYKQKDDFIISTIIHPVDRVYEMYFFITALRRGVALPKLGGDIKQFYCKQLNLFNDHNNSVTLEAWVDSYIESKGVFIMGDNIETDENSCRQTNIVNGNNDFVGFMSDPACLLKTAVYLNGELNTKIELSELFAFYNKIQKFCTTHTYRRKDLEKLLAEDIEHFYGLRKQYMGF